jgi:hypothetical protein
MGLADRHTATAAALSLVLCAGALRVMAETLESGERAAAKVAVRQLQVGPGGRVSGVLENTSIRALRDVRLLVRHTWLWSKERAPQRDNPGRAVYYVVPDEIPPDGSVAFTYKPDPPLPIRSDGHFETSVEVVGFTEVGE